jgi:hypothetical protein
VVFRYIVVVKVTGRAPDLGGWSPSARGGGRTAVLSLCVKGREGKVSCRPPAVTSSMSVHPLCRLTGCCRRLPGILSSYVSALTSLLPIVYPFGKLSAFHPVGPRDGLISPCLLSHFITLFRFLCNRPDKFFQLRIQVRKHRSIERLDGGFDGRKR